MERSGTRLFTIIAVVLFLIIFAALLTVATIFDLDISRIMTKNSLPEGQYFSTSGFGLFFEAMGSSPIYIMAALAGAVGFWWGARKEKRGFKIAAPVICAIIIFAALYLFVNDIFKYVGEHMHNEEYMSEGYVQCLVLFLTLIISLLLTLSWRQIKAEDNDKLFRWALVIVCTLAIYLVIHFVKSPIGRMRYRAMNYSDEYGFEYFTRWYVVNGKRNLVPAAHGVEIGDSCKSFPSGHTFSAGVIYTLLCLPDVLEKLNKKWIKALLYVVTIGFTGLVAVSRIVVGAHFMSDVLFGGTLAFAATFLFRELIIFRGAHIKQFFPAKDASETEAGG